MSKNEDDLPTLVFSGEDAEVLFLKSFLESSGIETSVVTSMGSAAWQPSEIHVRRRDARAAHDLIADFLRNRTESE